ncbi:MAG: FtsX-like permease family protein [Gammaproteobacteria bacterium]|jgi:lipoprotein-releasing system permease protein|nr:FtsX-like permease family protein [Gammaproteobacteria bacterium]
MINDWRVSMALRMFGSASGNRLMSFIGFLSVSGLTLAVAVLVIVLSVVNGFEKELKDRVLGVLPHGTLYTRQSVFDWQSERSRVLQHADVLSAAPIVEGSGLAVNGQQLQGIQFRGINPELESEISLLPSFMLQGSIGDLGQSGFNTVIGAELAKTLGLVVGDDMTLILPNVVFSLAGPAMTTRRLHVVGLFRVGADIDKNLLLLDIGDAMKIKRQNSVDGLVVRLRDLFEAPRVLHELILSAESDDLFAVSWMRQNGNLYEAIRTQKVTMFFLLMILVAVAAFNIVSNLVMTVDDNKGEIAILKTMGASPTDLRMVFICHGMAVCMTGLAFGLAIGILLTMTLGPTYAIVSDWFGLDLMSEYFIRYLPTDIQGLDIVTICGVSLLICLGTTIYPATKAARANPVEVLAHEV